MKAPGTMALEIWKDRDKPISLAEFGAEIERRRQAAGNPVVPRNSGTRRTESKRALLAAIDAAAKAKGFSW